MYNRLKFLLRSSLIVLGAGTGAGRSSRASRASGASARASRASRASEASRASKASIGASIDAGTSRASGANLEAY